MGDSKIEPSMVAGHSLGEFSALVACSALDFEDALVLVKKRALAMQKACEIEKGTMAAILGLEDEKVEEVCKNSDGVVVAANYNCPGQLVISGSLEGIENAVKNCQEAGARKAIVLPVGGAFHSPLMQPAMEELKTALINTNIKTPTCPVYQNVDAQPQTDPPVKWTQTMKNMIADGATEFIEVGGTGKVLRGFVMRVERRFPTSAI